MATWEDYIAHFEQVMSAPVPPDVMEKTLGIMMENVQQHFADQGPGWDEITPKYRAWKERQGYSTDINIRTGALLNSFQTRVNSYTQGELFTEVPYALYVNNARPIFWIDDDAKQRIREMAVADIREGLRYGGR